MFVPITLSVEELVLLVCSYLSSCRGDCGWVWLSALSLLCRGDYCFGFVPYLLRRGGCVGERSCVLLTLYLQIPRWSFPVWEVRCGHSENPSVWRQRRRTVARTSKHILVFAFDPLSLNSISLISCITLYCSYLIHAWYCLCVHTCVELRELHIAPQLLI